MWHFSNSVWNSIPVNSPPGSCMHRWGHGYHASQHCAYFLATLSDVLSSILTSSTRLVTVSIAVSALNSYGLPRTWTIHGPIRSTVHSSNGIDRTSRSGNSPYCLPSICSFGNNHNWSDQYAYVYLNYNVADVCVHKVFCTQDDLWLDDTIELLVRLIH